MYLQDITFDANQDFWKVYPQFKTMGKFSEFYKGNTNYEETSKVMWFVMYVCHPLSKYNDLDRDDSRTLASKDVFGAAKAYLTHKKDLEYLIEAFESYDTQTERFLRTIREKIDEKVRYFRTTKYNADTGDSIDKALDNCAKNWETYKKIVKEYKEELESKKMGGGESSMSERNEI